MNMVTAVVVDGGAKVVTTQTVCGPRGTGVGVLVYHHQLPWGVYGMGKEIDGGVMDSMISRHRWFWGIWAEVVKGEFDIREELIPKVEGKLGVNTGEGSNHVVLKSAYGAFSEVSTVVGRWGVLGGDVVSGEERFDRVRLFVVTGEGRHGMVTGLEKGNSVSICFKVGR